MRKTRIIAGFTVLAFLTACTGRSGSSVERQPSDTVYIDTFYTAMFRMSGEGYTGGDGTYSVALPDGRTAWIFGDTFIGGVNNDHSRSKQVPRFIRNSLVIEGEGAPKTLFTGSGAEKASFVIPPLSATGGKKVSEDSVWYWPGDGLIENGQFKLFLSEFVQLDTGMWDFSWTGSWVAAFNLPSFSLASIDPLPRVKEAGIHFGHAVCETDEFTYVYGAGGGKPNAARYTPGEVLGSWEYFTGEGWTADPSLARPMAEIQGSEQFSVFREGESYILITQMGGFSDEICSFTSATPFGPWGNRKLLYKTPLPRESNMNIFTYNAVAHPEKTRNGELLISYNMNSMALEDHYRDESIYRPRFIRVPLKMILESAE
ncbi:MAG: DUF5005 domain-containing protein [Bacteroidota bacterium]